jgi:hypothetical protein
MKPVLQALVLADHVYTDRSGKKIIAGTFNRIVRKRIDVAQQPEPLIPGGAEMGCPWFYLSLTDVVDGTKLTLQFVSRADNVAIFEMPIKLHTKDRLATIEVVAGLPPIGRILQKAGEYAFDVVWEGEILGSHRLILEIDDGAKGDEEDE